MLTSAGQASAPTRTALPPEIAFLLAHGVPGAVLREGARIAARTGVPADEAILKNGFLGEDEFYRALAREIGAPFAAAPMVSALAQYPESIMSGLAPSEHSRDFIVAPRGPMVVNLLAQRRRLARQVVVTTPSALRRAVFSARSGRIADHAAHHLPVLDPTLSSRDTANPVQSLAGLGLVALGLLSMNWLHLPSAVLTAIAVALHVLFLAMITVRLSTVLDRSLPDGPWANALPDAALPVYTVIVALYRERNVAEHLVEALRALDYPAAKLDIKLVLEEDDRETAAALAGVDLPPFIEVLVAPPGLPRTKPRALNVALPLARGRYTVIYDAEDVPDPAQLRRAVAAFAQAAPDVACLQARLTIHNADQTWLTRLFALEYASLFDVVNPGLASSGLPIPLGGTSNHFRTAVLRRIGGWDAWNVTEDADLGIRLARFGYSTADLPSSTREEAPLRLGMWLHQRTRWMKGFLQTCITHSRDPRAVWQQLGPGRLAGAFALTFGAVASVMVYPVFTLAFLVGLAGGHLFPHDDIPRFVASYTSCYVFLTGAVAMIVPALIAVKRRRLWHLLPYVFLLPLYYGLVSVAAWRGLWELWRHPHRWNKTEHGLSNALRIPRRGSEAPGERGQHHVAEHGIALPPPQQQTRPDEESHRGGNEHRAGTPAGLPV